MADSESTHNYSGIDRLQYFLTSIGMFLAVVVAIMIFGPDSGVMDYLGLPLMVLSLVLDVLRLRNTGLSQWLAFVRFLPFGSLVLSIFLFSAQTGWIETRRWDSTGRNILIFALSLLALMLFMLFYAWAWEPVSYWDLLF